MRPRIALATAATVAFVLPATASGLTSPAPKRDCTSAHYRVVASQVYRPWYAPIGNKDRLLALRGCAPNRATLKNMARVGRALRAGRHRAVDRYRALTPYPGPGRTRWAIPYSIVACESGGSWAAANPSGAVGPYQLLGWGAPWPVGGMHDKMAHHRIASQVWAGGAGRGNWVC